VPLARPRALALTGEPEFAALKEQLLAPLREEARQRLMVAAP
jgi:hypothetical protein